MKNLTLILTILLFFGCCLLYFTLSIPSNSISGDQKEAIRIAKDDFKMDVSYRPNTNLNTLSFKCYISLRLRFSSSFDFFHT